jgi:hypothetical protein
MKRNGKTTAGTQRWRCTSCDASTTHRYDNTAKLLKEFLGWLLSRDIQTDMPGQGRSFRRKTSKFWDIWPMPPLIDEIHRVVYVDGIYLGRKAVILIARSDEYVLGWYLARSENSSAWEALLSRIAAPGMVVTDGGNGFEKARRRVWKDTKVQRCTFHAFSQIKRYTTTKPKLAAGVELYGLALDLLHIKDLKGATLWVESYLKWCSDWDGFLAERTYTDRHWEWTHDRLVKAKNSLNTLINKGTLFTYLDLALTEDGPLPATNNKIEGGVNAPLRQLLRDHRGMDINRRIKAVFWWCYMHTECPLTPAEILKTMPTDADIDRLYRNSGQGREPDGPQRWGDGIAWSELHQSGLYRMDWD